MNYKNGRREEVNRMIGVYIYSKWEIERSRGGEGGEGGKGGEGREGGEVGEVEEGGEGGEGGERGEREGWMGEKYVYMREREKDRGASGQRGKELEIKCSVVISMY